MSDADQMNQDSDRAGESATSERLGRLKSELFEHFGKLTRWKALCVERDAKTDEERVRLAEEILAAPSTGTVAEWYRHHLRLQGKKSFNVDEYLAGRRSSTARGSGDRTNRADDDQDGAGTGRS
jgi:hypothetical protein